MGARLYRVCVGEDCASGFTLRECDVVETSEYELSVHGVLCGGLLIHLRGGGLIAVEPDRDPCTWPAA